MGWGLGSVGWMGGVRALGLRRESICTAHHPPLQGLPARASSPLAWASVLLAS